MIGNDIEFTSFMSQLDNNWHIGDIVYRLDKSNGFIEPYEIIAIFNDYVSYYYASLIIESLLSGILLHVILDKDKYKIIACSTAMYGFDINKLYDKYIESKNKA